MDAGDDACERSVPGRDKTWSTDELRKSSHQWSLACDAGLLNKLQNMAQNLVTSTHGVQQDLDSLHQTVISTQSKLDNVVNDFLMLSNTQFVENRVFDEDVSDSLSNEEKKLSTTKTKEEHRKEIITKVSDALRLGMSVMDSAYEQIHVQDSDSEEDLAPSAHEPILYPKDPYASRSLPCIIGSHIFHTDDYVGLSSFFIEEEQVCDDDLSINNDEEENVAHRNVVLKTIDDRVSNEHTFIDEYDDDHNEESDLFIPKKKQGNFNDKEFTNDSGISHIENDDDISSDNRKFQKELAAKLRNSMTRSSSGNNSSSSSANEELAPPSKAQETSSNLSTNRNRLFGGKTFGVDDDAGDSDNDGLFFGKKGFGSTKRQLFDDSGDEDNLFGSTSQKKTSHDGDTLFKASRFSDSLFGDDSDTFMDVANKNAQKRGFKKANASLSIGGDVDSKPSKKSVVGVNPSSVKPPRNIRNDEKGGVNDEGRPGSRSSFKSVQSASFKETKKTSLSNSASSSSTALFVDDADTDDLFSVGESQPKRKPIGGISLFDDDVGFDSEDIFAPAPKRALPTESNVKSSDGHTVDSKSVETSKVFSADADDDLFFQIIKPKASTRKSVTALFDDDVSPESTSTTKVTSTTVQKPNKVAHISLFGEESDDSLDLFESKNATAADSSNKSKLSSSVGKGLFDDDDEDDTLQVSSDISYKIDLFGRSPDTSKDNGGMQTVEAPSATNSKPSLVKPLAASSGIFLDSDEVDLFGNASTKTSQIAAKSSRVLPNPLNSRENVSKEVGVESSPQLSPVQPPPESPHKKPVGGVPLFGGALLLKSQLKGASRSSTPQSPTERSPGEKPGSPSPFRENCIIPTQNVPVETSVTFDKPVNANPLHNANKDRAKIKVKRRLPTRRGRQEALRKSAIDVVVDEENADNFNDEPTSVSAPTSPRSPDPGKVAEFTTAVDVVSRRLPKPAKHTLLTAPSSHSAMVTSPSTEEEDLFSVGTEPVHPSPLVLAFAANKLRGIRLFEDEAGASSESEDSDGLFGGSKLKSTSYTKASSAKIQSSPDVVSSSATSTATKNKLDFEDSLNVDDDDGLFSTKAMNANVESTTDDLFGAAATTTNSHLEKSGKLTKGKSLFDDDDDDGDIFRTKPAAKIAAPASKPRPSVQTTKQTSGDLFDDPLMVNKKDS